jgi:hypothetical protein
MSLGSIVRRILMVIVLATAVLYGLLAAWMYSVAAPVLSAGALGVTIGLVALGAWAFRHA